MVKKYNLAQVKSIIEQEGLDYAIQSYMGHERIEDARLAALWKQAKEVLDGIEEMLEYVESDFN